MTTSVTLRASKGTPLTHNEVDANFTNLQTTADGAASDAAQALNDKANASAIGVTSGDSDMGTFTGATISDNVTAKVALQELETAVESASGSAATKANATAVGVSAAAADMGTYTGTTIPDNETAKQNLQTLETAVEARPTSATLAASGGSALIGGDDGSSGSLWTTVQGFVNYLLSSAGSSFIGFLPSGASATARTMQAKARDTLNAADFLPVGYVTDGSVDYTTQLQAAITAAAAQRKELIIPAGTFKASGLIIGAGTRIRGQGNENSWIKGAGNILRVSGEFVNVADLTIWSTGGAIAIKQDGLTAQGNWERCTLIQEATGYALWDNQGHEFIDMRFRDCKLQHASASTVYAFNLLGGGGIVNDNVWSGCRIQYSGSAHFFNVETNTANAQYSNRWEDCTFEVCLGGGIRLRGVNGYVIDNCQNWDAGAGAIVNHFYDAGTAAGIGSFGVIRDCGRWAGSFAAGKYDVSLPTGGAGAGTSIINCRTAGGGDPFTVNDNANGIYVQRLSVSLCSLVSGAGAYLVDSATGVISSPASFAILGTKVIGAQGAAISDPTGGATVDTEARSAISFILNRMRASTGHGLISG